jgi:endonuclease III
MTTKRSREIVDALLDQFGRTYAEEAGIRLKDEPSPLYQLLVVSTLLSARISANVAIAAAKELFAAGYRTPRAMREASWQDRVDALGRGHYRRYDESTATMLGRSADLLEQEWKDDLRRLRAQAGGDPRRIGELITRFPGIGPTGAEIFLREVQVVWTDLAPYFGERIRQNAAKLDLPTGERGLADLTASPVETARLAAAIVRAGRSPRVTEDVLAAAGGH